MKPVPIAAKAELVHEVTEVYKFAGEEVLFVTSTNTRVKKKVPSTPSASALGSSAPKSAPKKQPAKAKGGLDALLSSMSKKPKKMVDYYFDHRLH